MEAQTNLKEARPELFKKLQEQNEVSRPIQQEGNSTFRIPVALDADMAVSALTTAMSEPHLVEYTLYFDSATLAGK